MLGACASTGVQRQDVATASLDQVRSELAAGAEQVEKTDAALVSLRESEDLAASYKAYSSELSRLEKQASKVRQRRAAMQARLGDHVARWQDDLEVISSETARRASTERAASLKLAAGNLENALNRAKEAYEPYLSNLRDIELILANDLSRRGVEGLEETIAETLELSRMLRNSIGEATVVLAETRAEFQR
jgi:hypothetical protein